MSDLVETKVSLSEALSEVARTWAELDRLTTTMAAMLQAVKDTTEFRAMEVARADLSQRMKAAEDRAKALALDAFRLDGKKSRPGVTVKSFTTRRVVYDLNTAYKWAEANAKELIVLDTKLFEKHVLAVAQTVPVPCAQIEAFVEDRAQLSSDLSEFLE